jgi:hypothetical protein
MADDGSELRFDVAKKTDRVSVRERIRSWRSSRSKRVSTVRHWNWVGILKVVAVLWFLAASGAFLRYAEAYVQTVRPNQEGALVLKEVPPWADRDLKNRVATLAGGTRILLTEDTAAVVAHNLAALAWLDDIDVRVTHNSVCVKARWRKPIALIEKNGTKYYVDADLVVLDYMPMPHLPIVQIKGVAMAKAPVPGETFDQEDLAAGIKLLILLDRMDAEVTPQNPLLAHIASIDVSNFNGRRSRAPHIVLFAKEDTQIIWGAEIGEWAKYLEDKDDQKLAKLYTYYRDYGSLGAGVKYIKLCDPQDKLPLPVDKYR